LYQYAHKIISKAAAKILFVWHVLGTIRQTQKLARDVLTRQFG